MAHVVDEFYEQAVEETRKPYIKIEDIIRFKAVFCLRKITSRVKGKQGLQWELIVDVDPEVTEKVHADADCHGIITVAMEHEGKWYDTRNRHMEKIQKYVQEKGVMHSLTFQATKLTDTTKFYSIKGAGDGSLCYCTSEMWKPAEAAPSDVSEENGDFDPFLDDDDLP